MKCSKCGKEIDDFMIKINLNFQSYRMKSTKEWEYLPNLDVSNNETLCYKCFVKWTEKMK